MVPATLDERDAIFLNTRRNGSTPFCRLFPKCKREICHRFAQSSGAILSKRTGRVTKPARSHRDEVSTPWMGSSRRIPPSRSTTRTGRQSSPPVRSVHEVRIWISEGLTQADSFEGWSSWAHRQFHRNLDPSILSLWMLSLL